MLKTIRIWLNHLFIQAIFWHVYNSGNNSFFFSTILLYFRISVSSLITEIRFNAERNTELLGGGVYFLSLCPYYQVEVAPPPSSPRPPTPPVAPPPLVLRAVTSEAPGSGSRNFGRLQNLEMWHFPRYSSMLQKPKFGIPIGFTVCRPTTESRKRPFYMGFPYIPNWASSVQI